MPLLLARGLPATSAYPTLRRKREGWGTRSFVAGQEILAYTIRSVPGFHHLGWQGKKYGFRLCPLVPAPDFSPGSGLLSPRKHSVYKLRAFSPGGRGDSPDCAAMKWRHRLAGLAGECPLKLWQIQHHSVGSELFRRVRICLDA